MCILPPSPPHASPAALLSGLARLQLALDALRGASVSQLAAQNYVSRKFVYQQLHRLHQGLEQVFSPPTPPEELLFWLPVTKPWLQQLILGLVLICHSSFRGVSELLADLFDYPLGIGTVHNVLARAAAKAEPINHAQDLSAVRVGAHDEIFQAGKPVLVGADVRSTYCYLLSQQEQRDGDTWAVCLLELSARGFDPDAIIADFGTGLRAGQQQALPDVACRGDVFHPLRDFQTLSTYLDNRACEAMSCCVGLQRQQARCERRQGRKNRSVALKAAAAARGEEQAIALADDVRTLLAWWRQDVLAVAGPEHATRQALYDWIVSELQALEPRCPHRIGPVRRLLQNHQEELLAFARQLDSDVVTLAGRLQVSPAVVREALAVQQLDEGRPARWQREKELWRQLGEKYALLRVAVQEMAAGVVRASSVIENLNSRLRNYFFLRKQLGPGYLKLLQFYLNHRRFPRSAHAQRQGKSPRELLSGQEHRHWLELLGYSLFRQTP
jgi:hypothetical protein